MLRAIWGWLFDERAWVRHFDGETTCCRIKRLPRGKVIAKVYGTWMVVGQSFVKEVISGI